MATLDRVPLFAKLTAAERAQLLGLMQPKVFTAGEKIIIEGDNGAHFFILQSGECNVTKIAPNPVDPEIFLETLSAGDYFGETALLNNMRRGATITAKTAVRALVLDRPAFTAMVGQHRLDLKYGKRRAIGGLQNIVIPAASPAPAAAAKVEQDSKKSSRTRDLLRRAVLKNVLFQHLDANQNDAIVDAMCRVDLTAGETVIRQFEAGDYFYAVETGRLDVFVQKCNGAPQVNVNDLKGPGDCFGELALLYNAPRNATVVAVEDSVLWAIERVKFRAIIDRLSAQRIADIEKLLYKVPLLQKLTQAERVTLIGAIEVRAFQPGAIIVAQGSHNDSLQMVLSGKAVATQMMQGRSTELVRLRTGDFFGDRGLASTEIVPASVTAVTPVSMLLLSRDVLHTHMGSAAELNSRASVEKYSVIAQVKAATAVSAVPAVMEHSVDEPRKIQSWDRRKDFTVIGALGQGSFATVLLVRSRVTGETFALKTLQRHKIEVPAQQAHVLNERRVLAALDSPFLVRLYGTTKDEHCLGFVLEPCLAGEMSHFLQQRVRLPEASARFYLGCVVLGLEAMHSKNVIYRDLKPENLMLGNDGYIKIADFGLAKITTEQTHTICGTPDYLSPEVVSGQGHGKAVDWWAAGVFLFEMICGETPFWDDDIMNTYHRILKGSFTFPEYVSPHAKELIMKLLEVKPSKRLGSGRLGAAEIKGSQFFKDFDWKALSLQRIKAPFIPTIRGQEDLSNFESIGKVRIEDHPVFDKSKWDAEF